MGAGAELCARTRLQARRVVQKAQRDVLASVPQREIIRRQREAGREHFHDPVCGADSGGIERERDIAEVAGRPARNLIRALQGVAHRERLLQIRHAVRIETFDLHALIAEVGIDIGVPIVVLEIPPLAEKLSHGREGLLQKTGIDTMSGHVHEAALRQCVLHRCGCRGTLLRPLRKGTHVDDRQL